MSKKRRTNRITALSMIFVLLLSTISNALPFLTISAETNEQAIPENHLRIHYDYGDLELEDTALWLWDDVEEASTDWPNGEFFTEDQTTDFGAYLDIPLKEDANNVGFLVIYQGDNYVGDIKVELTDLDIYEIWVTHDGTVSTQKPTEDVEPVDPVIPESTRILRVHYQNNDLDLDDLWLWYWGDVTDPATGTWPTDGESFSEEQVTDFGGYVEIAMKDEAVNFGFQVVSSDETKPVDDTNIELISPEVDEIWVTHDGEVYYYEPIEFEKPTIRIHYQTESGVYEPWGVWYWNGGIVASGDVGEWSLGATPFSNKDVGPYGGYVDIELHPDASGFEFLLVERAEPDTGQKQTGDLSFADLANHRQIFIKEGTDQVFSNPYYVSDEEPEPEEHEGEAEISVEATVNRSFNYNEHALLDVEITNDSDLSIRRIEADVSVLGGSSSLSISPELNRVTLSVSSDIEPGEKTIPIKVVDETGGVYTTEATATITERIKAEGEHDWDESIIYFMLTDRFADGDPSNNDPYGIGYDQITDNPRGAYQGGDFKGVTENIDYLAELGVNTIWITPIVENVGYDVSHVSSDGTYYGYHGYWAKDFERLNPHLGTLAEFHELIDVAAEHNIDIMVDVVLNHIGYGLKPNESLEDPPAGYPTDEDRARFEGMIREESGSGDEKMELGGLPDFKTEEASVREQIVDWQTAWVEKSTTPNGNAIASYRVDTVKHVDQVTWQHFKNELVEIDPTFKLIGEAWEGNYAYMRYLNAGQMDSVLDFGFKGYARNFVNGNIVQANNSLIERNNMIASDATLGQFLGSHDEDGFLTHAVEGDEGKLKLAASLQITAKGQPVIYYGEELGQSGANNWPEYDNRYDFGWDIVEDNDILDHYQTVLEFRNDYSELLSRGTRSTVAGSNSNQWLVVERAHEGESVYVGFNVAEEEQDISLFVSNEDVIVTDHYSDQTYTATENEDGEFVVNLIAPSLADGGTLLLSVKNGNILPEEAENSDEVAEGYFRLHFEDIETSLFEQLNVSSLDELGLWLWDVADPSDNWPNGAMNFSDAVKTDFGHYIEFELTEPGADFGFLINTMTQGTQTDDFNVTLLSKEMNEAWVTTDLEIYPYQPLDIENSIRVNYVREDGNYDGWGLWTWGDVAEATSDWPNGAHSFEVGSYGSFYDLPLAENAGEIGFLLLNKETGEQTDDMSFTEIDEHTQIFVRDGDPNVYTNPYFASVDGLRNAEVLTDSTIELVFSGVDDLTEEALLEGLEIVDSNGESIDQFTVKINPDNNSVTITVVDGKLIERAPLEIKYDGREVTARVGWRLKDEMYAYDGDLGLNLRADGSAELKLWSPSADAVNVVLYDKDDQERIIDDQLAMTLGERGVWSIELDESNTGITDLTGYYYHFAIEREGETVLALDPYARSMAAWDSSNPDNYVGKAAIVDPSTIGPELDFANIDGFEKREDAIIYEVHVRDFTSDPSLEGTLNSQFGTFSAFAEKLDYIESLGVTHIQLLPVMSYFFADEFNNSERLLEYSSTDNNYNWGYDPQSYFSLTGMYSENPEDPAKRIEEFKLLIDEIHDRGMGIILDVVYNHTARVHIFEDLEPNYYHFMDADGTPREAFGGGRLGTTHEMARRILVDSITYWVEEYNVDGFRFDMMGDHDAETIQIAFDEAKAINPNILMIGEGWVTYAGDENYPNVQPADQQWMQDTKAVGSFSDDFRNELKSGFGHEGEPRFITGGARNIQHIYDNLTANPHNFKADDPGDVVPYIAAHDNLTLHDVIAQSIKKDPKDHAQEIHERIRLGNLMVLTAQGTPFIHAGQEFGRTKQFRHEDYIGEVPAAQAPYKSTFMTDENGTPFEYPYFIHDSYDSTDAINKFDWAMATDAEAYPINTTTQSYTTGLIALRRSTDAFSKGTMEEIDQLVSMIEAPEIGTEDLVIGYQAIDSNGDIYAVFVNADTVSRQLTLATDYSAGDIIVDGQTAGIKPINEPTGVTLTKDSIELDPLTATVIRLTADSVEEVPEEKDVIEIKPNEPTQIAPEQTIKISDDNGKVAQIETPKSLPEGTIIEVDFLDESEMEGATSATGKSIAKAGQVVSVNIEYPEGYQVIEGEFFTLTLSYDSDSDWVAIFYKGNNADSWERLGGKMDRSTETITIEIPHFSTYGVFEDALEDVIADLEADIKDLNDKIANLEGNNTDLKQELSDLKAKVTEIETENQELLAMIAQILAEIERLEAQLVEQEITTPEDVPGQDQTDEGSEGDQPEESEGTEGSEDETSVDSTESKGDALPKTATALYNYLLIGTIILALGIGLAFYTYKKRKEV